MSCGTPIFWLAIYTDGSTLYECFGDTCSGIHHAFKDIDLTKLSILSWIDARTQGALVSMYIHDEQTLPVLFRRNGTVVDFSTGTSYSTETIYCLGWESVNGNSYTFIMPDGSIRLSNKRDSVAAGEH